MIFPVLAKSSGLLPLSGLAGSNPAFCRVQNTLMSCPSSSTSSEIPPEDQDKIGLSPGLVRFSVGYTGGLSARLEQVVRAVEDVGLG